MRERDTQAQQTPHGAKRNPRPPRSLQYAYAYTTSPKKQARP